MTTILIMKHMQYISLLPLTTKEYKIILYILRNIISKEYRINQIDISEDLNISKSDVSKAFKKLIELNVLLKIEINQRRYKVKLNKYTEEELDSMIQNIIESY